MATILLAYDKLGNEIFPKGRSEGIIYENTNYRAYDTVKKAIDELFTRVVKVANDLSGATDVSNNLNVEVHYGRNADMNEAPECNADDFSLPDENNPYSWKKTTYYWGDAKIGDDHYEIVATANYPETQFRYTSLPSAIMEFGGPGEDEDNDGNLIDKTNNTVKWYTTPQSISTSNPCLYMVSRYRKANQSWDDITWGNPALIGNYAFNSVLTFKYKISTTSTCENPNDVCLDNGNLSWSDHIEYSDLQTGTNYIFLATAVQVNGVYQKAYSNNYWSTPSLISIINK